MAAQAGTQPNASSPAIAADRLRKPATRCSCAVLRVARKPPTITPNAPASRKVVSPVAASDNCSSNRACSKGTPKPWNAPKAMVMNRKNRKHSHTALTCRKASDDVLGPVSSRASGVSGNQPRPATSATMLASASAAAPRAATRQSNIVARPAR